MTTKTQNEVKELLKTILQRLDMEPKESVFPCSAMREDIRKLITQIETDDRNERDQGSQTLSGFFANSWDKHHGY